MSPIAKTTICLWYNHDAHEAAHFYAQTFPNSVVGAIHRAPSDFPGGKAGDVLTVEFTVFGIACIGLNGGDVFKHSEAFSFQVATDDQAETDRYWDAIVGNGGAESQCGWCKDKWGLSWQITPRALTDAMAMGGDASKRAHDVLDPIIETREYPPSAALVLRARVFIHDGKLHSALHDVDRALSLDQIGRAHV